MALGQVDRMLNSANDAAKAADVNRDTVGEAIKMLEAAGMRDDPGPQRQPRLQGQVRPS